ncbi:hypothetical protein F5Y10DRAFT_289974 [Nemania abortiva]|nr:hypothetical protein F5Y10DRAFT_289974 [Nemania abortiva]
MSSGLSIGTSSTLLPFTTSGATPSNSSISLSTTAVSSSTSLPFSPGNSASLTGSSSLIASSSPGSSTIAPESSSDPLSTIPSSFTNSSSTVALSPTGSPTTVPISSSGSLSTNPSSSTDSAPSSSSATSTTQTTQGTTEQFSLTPVASFPAYTAPTATIAGTAETSIVVAIAPLFAAIRDNRGSLLDSQTKQQYIKDVTNTRNQIESLNDNLADKSEPPSECSSTSGSGSLISGILNVLTTPSKLIGCAAKVASNLVNSVNVDPPNIAEIEVLTDTLDDIANQLQNSRNNPSNSDQQPSSTGQSTKDSTTPSSATGTTSSSTSECSTTVAPSCAETITLSTLLYTDKPTTSSEVKTITTTTCVSITASCAQATTATTTVSTASTSSSATWICDQTCAAGGCALSKRTAQTPDPAPDSDGQSQRFEKRYLKPISMITDVNKYIIDTLKASNVEGLDWSRGIAVANYYPFLNKALTRYVAGVTGCTSIVITSEKGAWLSHFTETGLMDDAGRQQERNSLDQAVRNGNAAYVKPSDLANAGEDLNKESQNVKIYVSAPCVYTTDASGNKACMGSADEPTWEYARIDALLTTLFGAGTPFEGVAVTKRGYIKPESRDEVDDLADTSARGKVVVQYDPNQLTDDFTPYNPKHAATRVWLESSPYQRDWVASSCQGGNAPNQKRDGSCPSDSGAPSSSPTPTNTTMLTITTALTTSSGIGTNMTSGPLTSLPAISTSSILFTSISVIPTSVAIDSTFVSVVTGPTFTATLIA